MKKSELQPKHHPLQDATIAALEPESTAYRVRDTGDSSLYLHVRPDGRRNFELRFKRPDGTWSWMGLGAYGKASHQLSAAKARKKANDLVEATPWDSDALTAKRQREKEARLEKENTFEKLARMWLDMKRPSWVDATTTRNVGALEKHIFPTFGHRPFRAITKQEWSEHLLDMRNSGIAEMTRRILFLCRDIYDWAIDKEMATTNPLDRLVKDHKKPASAKMKHVKEHELSTLIRAIRGYPGRVAGIGLQLLVLNANRPTELREAQWSEFDLDNALWTIPASRMKLKKDDKATAQPHYIPLSRQSVALLRELHYLTGAYTHLFPGRSNTKKPASNTIFIMALRRLGYADRQTPHGFRHVFSTYANERGHDERFIEKSLAHVTPGVKGIYNLAAYLKPRRELMQWWADEIDRLAADVAEVKSA